MTDIIVLALYSVILFVGGMFFVWSFYTHELNNKVEQELNELNKNIAIEIQNQLQNRKAGEQE